MKVHEVKKARKAIPYAGIAKGDSYYWWKFRRGGKRVSKVYPRRSQLTQSEFLSEVYDLEDVTVANALEAYRNAISSLEAAKEDLVSALNEAKERLEELAGEQEDKKSNMPDSLQDSETGQLLEERASKCEEVASELDGVVDEVESIEIEIDNADAVDGVSWDF